MFWIEMSGRAGQERKINRKKGKKEVLAVEKSGKEAPAKQAQAGGSGKEAAADVAVADKQDGTSK